MTVDVYNSTNFYGFLYEFPWDKPKFGWTVKTSESHKETMQMVLSRLDIIYIQFVIREKFGTQRISDEGLHKDLNKQKQKKEMLYERFVSWNIPGRLRGQTSSHQQNLRAVETLGKSSGAHIQTSTRLFSMNDRYVGNESEIEPNKV